eukprot:365016-Chlamydomonas_euryale.AAC.7
MLRAWAPPQHAHTSSDSRSSYPSSASAASTASCAPSRHSLTAWRPEKCTEVVDERINRSQTAWWPEGWRFGGGRRADKQQPKTPMAESGAQHRYKSQPCTYKKKGVQTQGL